MGRPPNPRKSPADPRLRPILSPGRTGRSLHGNPDRGCGRAKRERRRSFSMGLKIAVIGATGNVGREMLTVLEERAFPADEVVAIASRRSQGTEVSFGDRVLKVQALENYDFRGTDIALMSAGGVVSKEWSPKLAAQGCIVIDNSSAWRYDQDVPLIVPEVNADAIEGFSRKNIIANPNCSTAQLVVALKPLHERAKIL